MIPHFFDFLLFQTFLKDAVFTSFCLGLFFSFFVTFWCFSGGLRRSLGTLWDRLGSLWRSRVALLGAFGSSGLFFVSFWYFFVTRGRKGGLSAQLCVFCMFSLSWALFFHAFPGVFSPGNVVEAAPQARPKTTAVSNTALRPLLCSPSSF